MNQGLAKQAIENFGDDFKQWLEDRDLDEKEETIWLFHYWMRRKTDLSSGVIFDYRKYVAEFLDEDGRLGDIPNEISGQKQAAVNKFQEFSLSDLAKTNATGDSE